MPLSKKRDRERKHRERTKSRLDRLLCPPHQPNCVQPNRDVLMPPKSTRMVKGIVVSREHGQFVTDVELDADGNIIPEY